MTDELRSCGASEPFALRVIGDDMAPEFNDGHIVVVDPGGRLTSGCFVVARHADEVLLRCLDIVDGRYRLRALKSGLPEIEIEGIESVVGVVSQRAGRRRREHRRYDV